MESKAMFDIDSSNSPVIKLEVKSTTDLRDKVAKRFIEALGHESQWCEILSSGEGQYTIFPLTPAELRDKAECMLRRASKLEEETAKYASVALAQTQQ
jgi:hypothetical protein